MDWTLVPTTTHFSPFKRSLGVHSRFLSTMRTPNSRNHSYVHYSLNSQANVITRMCIRYSRRMVLANAPPFMSVLVTCQHKRKSLKNQIPSWPKLLQNNSLEPFFVIVFVLITKIIHQKFFFVMLLPLAGPFLQENKPRNLLCKVILFVIITKLIAPKHFLCKDFFCNNFGRGSKLL